MSSARVKKLTVFCGISCANQPAITVGEFITGWDLIAAKAGGATCETSDRFPLLGALLGAVTWALVHVFARGFQGSRVTETSDLFGSCRAG